MKVTGFSIIKNAVQFDYPIVAAIQSILPICDDFIIAIGDSDDGTEQLIEQIKSSKIKVVKTQWNQQLRKGGYVLAEETNKALKHIPKDSDWAFYIQGDEVIHEKYLQSIHKAMQHYKEEVSVDGLLFEYVHFYGSYDYIGNSSKWYSHEIRVIKNQPNIYSYRDAQGFRKDKNKKLKVVPIEACVYHYGWVKHPQIMQQKKENSIRYYHNDEWIKKNTSNESSYDYAKKIENIRRFKGKHPKVMEKRIAKKNWEFLYDISKNKVSIKDRIKFFLKTYLGINSYYVNYKIIRPKKKG